MKTYIKVFEHDKLKSNDEIFISNNIDGKKIIDRLCKYNDKNSNKYFDAIYNGVKFKNYVGVIKINNIIIEILPKADSITSSELNKEIWHKNLLLMLARCRYIKVESVSESSLKRKNNSILDLYFQQFLIEINSLLEEGLCKQYRYKYGSIKALKGQLKFDKNIRLNYIHKERFYTKHQVYDFNNLINRTLLKALQILKNISYSTKLKDSINRTLSRFPEIDYKLVTDPEINRIVLNRNTQKYSEALKIAKMIILNYSPDISKGNENMIAILFDMNKLWEEFVFRTLKKEETENLKVHNKNFKNFWNNKKVKPDIVLEIGEENGKKINYIIDTKWKIIEPNNPSDSDLKQMYVYNMYWNATKSMLLYPTIESKQTNFGSFHIGKEGDNKCKLGFVQIINEEGSMNDKLGKEILGLISN